MILKQNIQFLSEGILNELENADLANIDFKKSKDNLKIPFFQNAALHSTYYPLKEGTRINTNGNEKKLCFAIGLGAGYHLVEVAKKVKKTICIPADIPLLKSILQKLDLSTFFTKEKFIIIKENEIIEHFDFFTFKEFFITIHPVLEKFYSKQILGIIKKINETLKEPLVEANTQRKFGKLWLKNIIKSIRLLANEKLNFSAIIIDKRPILITGAGPSLIHNIDLIKKHAKDLFIAATDTSYKILDKYGIIPDALFSFDAQHFSYLHFTGMKNKTRLFTDFTSPLNTSKKTLLFSNHPLKEVFKKAGWHTISLPSETRNIGGALINFFSKHFPDYPIISAGIDYAGFDYTMYSRGSYLSEYKLINSNYFYTPDNIDTSLFYKNNFIKEEKKWKTTLLMQLYSEKAIKNKNVYTLSTSPFNTSQKTASIEALIEQAKESSKTVLDFKSEGLDNKKLFSLLIEEVNNNPQTFNSYFLSIQKYPDEQTKKDLIEKIKKWSDFYFS